MIHLKEITSREADLYAYMEKLIVAAFPTNEYRPLEELKDFTDNRDNFHMNILFDESLPIGLISYWSFDHFYYIEHFTTDSKYRNKGYGSQALEAICKQLDKAIVLEIELPDNEMAIRRENFYNRNHFVTWPNDYMQPPYREEEELLPLKICCYGELSPEKDFETVKRLIHTEVYNYND